MDERLNVLAHFVARDERVGDLRSLLRGLIEPTRAEPGCLSYRLWEHRERAGTFTLVEEWRSEADLDEHFETPHLRDAIARLEDLLAEPLRLEKYRSAE